MSALNAPGLAAARAGFHSVRFILLAEADPGLLPRLLIPLARRDLTPDRLSATRRGDHLHVEIALDTMPGEVMHLVEGNLRQVIGVHAVHGEITPACIAAAA